MELPVIKALNLKESLNFKLWNRHIFHQKPSKLFLRKPLVLIISSLPQCVLIKNLCQIILGELFRIHWPQEGYKFLQIEFLIAICVSCLVEYLDVFLYVLFFVGFLFHEKKEKHVPNNNVGILPRSCKVTNLHLVIMKFLLAQILKKVFVHYSINVIFVELNLFPCLWK